MLDILIENAIFIHVFFPGVVDEIIQNAILGYNYMNSNL